MRASSVEMEGGFMVDVKLADGEEVGATAWRKAHMHAHPLHVWREQAGTHTRARRHACTRTSLASSPPPMPPSSNMC